MTQTRRTYEDAELESDALAEAEEDEVEDDFASVDVVELVLFDAEVVELFEAVEFELVMLALEPDTVVVADDVPEIAEPDMDDALPPEALPLGWNAPLALAGGELPDAGGGPATVNVKDPKTVSTPDCPLEPKVISSPPTRDTLVT